MATETKNFSPVSPSAFQAIRANLTAQKVVLLNSPVGGPVDATHGLLVSWNYDAAASNLEIVLNGDQKDWYVSMSAAWSKIEDQINPYVGQ